MVIYFSFKKCCPIIVWCGASVIMLKNGPTGCAHTC